jgi:hypothetical protein
MYSIYPNLSPHYGEFTFWQSLISYGTWPTPQKALIFRRKMTHLPMIFWMKPLFSLGISQLAMVDHFWCCHS